MLSQPCPGSVSLTKGKGRYSWRFPSKIRIGLLITILFAAFYILRLWFYQPVLVSYDLSYVSPEQIQWSIAVNTITNFKSKLSSSHRSVQPNLVLYFVDEVLPVYSLDVISNNVKMFTSLTKRQSSGRDDIFYLFNVINGDKNPLHQYLPSGDNVAIVEWRKGTQYDITLKSLLLLSDALLSFSHVYCMNQFVRPLKTSLTSDWMLKYETKFKSNVGVVASSVSCEGDLHFGNELFVISTKVLVSIINSSKLTPRQAASMYQTLSLYNAKYTSAIKDMKYSITLEYNRKIEIAISEVVLLNGYKIVGMGNSDYKCNAVNSAIPNVGIDCASKTLAMTSNDFISWGALEMRNTDGVCPDVVTLMKTELSDWSLEFKDIDLVTPETTVGSGLYQLYKDYSQEELSYAVNSQHKPVDAALALDTAKDSRVCFLVRTGAMHDTERRSINSTTILYGIPELVKSLVGQSNSNWLMFAFQTDPNPFYARLHQILSSFDDVRLVAYPVPQEYLPSYTSVDAGYTATDYVLKSVLSNYPQCKWISATNGDNVYGSHLVEYILNSSSDEEESDSPTTSMLLAPVDSRNFAEQDYMFRKEKVSFFKNDLSKNKHLPKFKLRNFVSGSDKKKIEYNLRCTDIMANMLLSLYAYSIQPRPMLGKVDLASIFLLRESLVKENIWFSNFTDPDRLKCYGCQDGYLTEYLVRNRNWSYRRLPIDGLKSIVFHGPSPTWCIASGNVWFDHPHVNKVGCLTQKTIKELYTSDVKNGKKTRYDWNYYLTSDYRQCIRLSSYSYPLEPFK